jgi:hypothetical protein
MRNQAPPLTRDAYESACIVINVIPRSDIDLVRFLEDEYDCPPPSEINQREVSLMVSRAWAVERERSQAAAVVVRKTWNLGPNAPLPGGQIWDNCPQCDAEPVYTPLLICQVCWPKV